MNNPLTRRGFLGQSALIGAGLATGAVISRLTAAEKPSNKVRVGIMGLGRGTAHIGAYCSLPGVEVAYVCDVDSRRLDAGLAAVRKKQTAPVKGVGDFRRILDDPSIDAISIAAPSFWHTPAAVLACAAGKHVYVEKPGSYDAQEAEWIVAAARRHGRLVQMGAQRRSSSWFIEAIGKLRSNAIGPVRLAKCWYSNSRGTIGVGKPAPVPGWLDYDLWQGPVAARPYLDNLVHYNWHWQWHWGGGELANNGVHYLDVARWGLGVDHPRRVTCSGGRYRFHDDQQTPDTGDALYDFGDKAIAFEWSSCHPRRAEPLPGIAFYGDGGSLALRTDGYSITDFDGKEIDRRDAKFDEVPHFANFVEAIRGNASLNLEIAEGQKSALLCHLGNIAWRSGRTVDIDPHTGKMISGSAGEKLLGREYRPGWNPQV
jgi:predicted dehydrogenase